MAYTAAYNILFLGFGILVVIGVIILLFFSGPFAKNKELYEYAEGEGQLVGA